MNIGEKARVRQECPEIADWLNAMTQAFGKLAAIEVTMNGKTLYERGELLPVKVDRYRR